MDIYCQFGWSFGVCFPLVGGTMWVFHQIRRITFVQTHPSVFAAHNIFHNYLANPLSVILWWQGFPLWVSFSIIFLSPPLCVFALLTLSFTYSFHLSSLICPRVLFHTISARRGQMRMNSTTVSTWEVMEVNSVFGIGYFKPMGPTRGGGWSDQSNR